MSATARRASSSGPHPVPRARLDVWLWRARFFKTRALAAAAASGGKVRVNGAKTVKPGLAVKVGDALAIVRSGRVDAVEIQALGVRRGPAAEARTLYLDLASPSSATVDRLTSDAPRSTSTAEARDVPPDDQNPLESL